MAGVVGALVVAVVGVMSVHTLRAQSSGVYIGPWEDVSPQGGWWDEIYCPDPGVCFVEEVGSTNKWRTLDGGLSWQNLPDLKDAVVRCFGVDHEPGWCLVEKLVGNSVYLYMTYDTGKSIIYWSQIGGRFHVNAWPEPAIMYGNEWGYLRRSVDTGKTWEPLPRGNIYGYRYQVFAVTGKDLLTEKGDTILISRDTGNTWHILHVDTTCMNVLGFGYITAPSGSRRLISVKWGCGSYAVSYDTGHTWEVLFNGSYLIDSLSRTFAVMPLIDLGVGTLIAWKGAENGACDSGYGRPIILLSFDTGKTWIVDTVGLPCQDNRPYWITGVIYDGQHLWITTRSMYAGWGHVLKQRIWRSVPTQAERGVSRAENIKVCWRWDGVIVRYLGCGLLMLWDGSGRLLFAERGCNETHLPVGKGLHVLEFSSFGNGGSQTPIRVKIWRP